MSITSTPSTTVMAPAVPTRGALRPLGQGEVRIVGGFWGERQQVNHAATLRHIVSRLESEGWLPNFDLAAAGRLPAGRRGREFSDSEVYKMLEALAWEIGRTDDDELEAQFRSLVRRVVAAQEDDGYLNTMFGRPGQSPRWSDLEWGHELYCLGHLFQAAVARIRTRPDADDGLVAAAVRAADLVWREFGPDARVAVDGHPEIEVALAELGRAVGEPRYGELTRLFVERRGRQTLDDIEWGRSYFQDDVPVRDADVLRGHAVRANYLAAGATDVAVETGDRQLANALRDQWRRTVARRTYLTGGQGSHHQDEAFGVDWELPPDRAYSETCAGIGSIMFSWRLLLLDGAEQYADLIERTLYNVVATSLSDDGTAFFYSNTLQQRVPGEPADPAGTSPRAAASMRAPWFEVSCCPPNLARTLASLDAYLATATGDGIQVHQYAPSEIRTELDGIGAVGLRVHTAYPRDGVIRVEVLDDARAPWTLSLRVPEWARDAEARLIPVSGAAEPLRAEPGRLDVRRRFEAGDVVELLLPVEPRLTSPDPRIDAVRGAVAVERGPEVLALESIDLGADVEHAEILADEGAVDLEGRTWVTVRVRRDDDPAWPYGAPEDVHDRRAYERRVPLTAYHSWGARGPSTMRVWIPVAASIEHPDRT